MLQSEGNAVELAHVELTVEGHRIIDGIDWCVRSGTQAAVLGPNGCGKSSLLRLICGYLFPSSGAVRTLGSAIGKVDLDGLRRRIGIVDPTGHFVPDGRLSALEVVLSGFFGHLCLDFDEPTPEQVRRSVAALKQVGLAEKQMQRFDTLSTGEGRRVLLARATVADPELLLLDEPTAGLDLPGRTAMLRRVRDLSRLRPSMSTLVVTHHLEELPFDLGNVLLLSHGKAIAAGLPDTVLTSENISRAFGCDVGVVMRNNRWTWTVLDSPEEKNG